MAKGPANDDLITKGELKAALNKASDGGAPFALSMTGDGEGLLLAAKKGKAKKLAADMKKSAKDNKLDLKPPQPFFGIAIVDEALAPAKIVFRVNKQPPAPFRMAILKLIKPLTYSELEFMVDEGLENETEEDDEQEGQPTAAAPPQPDSAPDSAPPPPPPPVDMASLRAELMGLIQKWQGGAPIDPAQADAMKGLATAGIAAVKAGDAPEVAKAVTAMKGLLGAPSTAAPPSTSTSAPQAAPAVAPAPGKFVAMQKSRLIWDSARKRVAGELQALRAAITDAAKGDQEVAAIMAALNQLDDILVNLDESLLDKLDELLSTTEPGAHAKLLQEAKAIIAQYVAYTQSSQLVAKLDGNTPFGVKLSVASTMGTTLKALQATIV